MNAKAEETLGKRIKAYFCSYEFSGKAARPDSKATTKLKQELKKHFGEYGSPDLLMDVAEDSFKEAVQTNVDISPQTGRAGEMLSADLMDISVREVLAFFLSLPRKYNFFFPLSEDSHGRGGYAVGGNISICEFPEELEGQIHETGPNFGPPESVIPELEHTFRPLSAYLCIQDSGLYAARRSRCKLTPRVISTAKKFLLLSRCFGAYTPYLRPQAFQTGFVVDPVDPSRLSAFALPDTLGRSLAEWGWNWWDNPNLNTECDRHTEGISEAELMTHALRKDLRLAVSAIEDLSLLAVLPEGFSRSCSWALDAIFEAEDAKRALLLGLAFEALLGERLGKKEQAITARLGDRLAFLVGRSQRHREAINTSFQTFYGLRSSVAHGSQESLSQQEKDSVGLALEYYVKALFVLLNQKELSEYPSFFDLFGDENLKGH